MGSAANEWKEPSVDETWPVSSDARFPGDLTYPDDARGLAVDA